MVAEDLWFNTEKDHVPNPLLLFAAQIVAIFSVLLLAAGYIKTDPKATSARVFALMAVFVILYLLNGMTADHIDSNPYTGRKFIPPEQELYQKLSLELLLHVNSFSRAVYGRCVAIENQLNEFTEKS